FIERVASKLGADAICRPALQPDHRPEAAQCWVSATLPARSTELAPSAQAAQHQFRPAWLMAEPLRLLVRDDKPYYQGPLQLIQGPERLEASELVNVSAPHAVVRDYFIAWNAHAGLLWVFRERLVAQPGWFLHGLFA
ncbi:MAG: DNA polymerase Y family protein, partial [Brachymonas sp.]